MAYGKVPPPERIGTLDARLYLLPQKAVTKSRASVFVWPINCALGEVIPIDLQKVLLESFNEELVNGITYPQRGPMSEQEFAAYFLSYDLIIGLYLSSYQTAFLLKEEPSHKGDAGGRRVQLPVNLTNFLFDGDNNSDSTQWDDHYAFSYYIKPNYPGRSSHLCNAGFIVPPQSRGLGIGGIAGRSFVYYGPLCGYRGSVFNLVYANNQASISIWERLGFSRVGSIPQAGLLKRADDQGEEYVDAWVIHGDFQKLAMQNVDV